MPQKAIPEEVITMDFGPISSSHVSDFASATGSSHFQGLPLTFPTVFRATEFQWLDRLEIDMRQLLHTEQEYEYIEPLNDGDPVVVSTRVYDRKERRGMLFVTLESEVKKGGSTALRARSSFVVRQEPNRG